MTLHNTKEMSLVLSSDAKPRLKWTQELHQRFVDAVIQLGGPEKATPKSLMRVMGINGLTLYHLKSHLQKYRLGRSQQSQMYQQNKQEDDGENQTSPSTDKISIGAHEDINENLQVAQALQMQMDVQKKLHEQIEVQRHLQLRIEAQGKYLQSVLKKAHETLSDYSSCSSEVEQVKAQLSQLVSMVDSGCPSSSTFSVLTESYNNSMLKNSREKVFLGRNGYSVESSLTSSDSSGRKKEEIQTMNNKRKTNPVVLSLMEMRPEKNDIESDNRKRSKNGNGPMNFDLNCDLNCNGGVEV
ncbi:myb family transcription factor apl [Phtheirospermum japonicum]|uniref:Myb family transcription factor apl n=1 Tax=Phtheirospermum japonicum TaxID=374723 RepID=A0A830BPS1_9LAMI|nr:myb family transcription factor apl [Phtheirospermum japonicum]